MTATISFDDYRTACLTFAAATRDFGALNAFAHYTTADHGDDELGGNVVYSSDNAHGGLDVRWAFRQSDSEIDRQAAMRYQDALIAAQGDDEE